MRCKAHRIQNVPYVRRHSYRPPSPHNYVRFLFFFSPSPSASLDRFFRCSMVGAACSAGAMNASSLCARFLSDVVFCWEGTKRQGQHVETLQRAMNVPLRVSASWPELPSPLASRSTLLMRVACRAVRYEKMSHLYRCICPIELTLLGC